MPKHIDPARVTSVRLPDGWHSVAGGSFTTEGYSFCTELEPLEGFTFRSTDNELFAGPLSSIITVVSSIDPEELPKPKPLPDWCGQCEGPELEQRVVEMPVVPGEEKYPPRVAFCPRCHPNPRARATSS